MKCQSEYGTEVDTLLNQADLCIEEWWEGELPKEEACKTEGYEEEVSTLIVEREVRKRGLNEADVDATL